MSAMRNYDAWRTREPDWYDNEPVPYRCGRCGKFLCDAPDGKREWVVLGRCDGQPKLFEDEHDEGVLAIIGEEHRGRTFMVAYKPDCGTREGGHEGDDYDFEIRPEDADGYRHAPHWYVEPHGWCRVALRTCGSCGFVNEESML